MKYRSKLLELNYFNVCGGGLVADVMHDLLEGTLQYEAKLVLKHVIAQHYMTYKTFADLLEGLELGYMEMDNKPTMIPSRVISSEDKHLGQKGTTMYMYNVYTCIHVVLSYQLLRCGFRVAFYLT